MLVKGYDDISVETIVGIFKINEVNHEIMDLQKVVFCFHQQKKTIEMRINWYLKGTLLFGEN